MTDTAEPAPPPRPYRGWAFWGLFWLLIAFGLGTLVNESETFTECVHTHKNRKEDQTLHERVGVFDGSIVRERTRLRLLYVCAVDFADKDNGAIVALATVVVAFFTFTLWRSTHGLRQVAEMQSRDLVRSTNAAERNADIAERSLVALNRPYVMVGKFDNFPVLHKELDKVDDPMDKRSWLLRIEFNLDYRLENYGRSLATIHDICYRLEPMVALPEIPPYIEDLRAIVGNPVKVAKSILTSTWGQTYRATAPIVDRPQCERIEFGEESYFFCGFVRYSDVFLGKTYITAQALRYDFQVKAWATVENTAYNYEMEQEAAQRMLARVPTARMT